MWSEVLLNGRPGGTGTVSFHIVMPIQRPSGGGYGSAKHGWTSNVVVLQLTLVKLPGVARAGGLPHSCPFLPVLGWTGGWCIF